MSRSFILVEGQTEETFVREVLAPHFQDRGLYLTPIVVVTKRAKSGPFFKGGVNSYRAVKRDLRRLLLDTDVTAVTTMIDFYGIPDDFPGYGTLPAASSIERVRHLEESFAQDISDRRFVPHLSLHEFEALLFSDPDQIAVEAAIEGALRTRVTQRFRAMRAGVSGPEDIDEGPSTAPSKRIKAHFPDYLKILHGNLIAIAIGLARIRQECPHFDAWLRQLEALAPTG